MSKNCRFKKMYELEELIPSGVEEFEITKEEYDRYYFLLSGHYPESRNIILRFRGVELIIKEEDHADIKN